MEKKRLTNWQVLGIVGLSTVLSTPIMLWAADGIPLVLIIMVLGGLLLSLGGAFLGRTFTNGAMWVWIGAIIGTVSGGIVAFFSILIMIGCC